MIIKYINHQNQELVFFTNSMKAIDGTFHSHKYKTDNMTLEDASYEIAFTLRGEDRHKRYDEMLEVFDLDTSNNKQGKIYFGDYYFLCNAVANESELNGVNRIAVTIEFYGKQEWVKEREYHLENQEEEDGDKIKKYTYKYPYIYSFSPNARTITNDSYNPSDLIIKLHGIANNPFVKIGDIIYQVNISILEDEYVEINTAKETIEVVDKFGERSNAFMYRSKDNAYFFQKMPTGAYTASWNNVTSVDIILLEKRPEPRLTT